MLIGFDITKSVCYECNLDSYLSQGLLSKDQIDPLTDCSLKNPLDTIYKIDLFVSNIKCSLTQPSCLGSKSNPFDNLIFALNFIHNIEFAQKYNEQDIKIYLLGGPHFLMDSDLLSQNVRFFRRMNAKILIQPWFCEDELIQGCVSLLKNELIDVVIKTDNFIFEINREFTMKNINLIGRDIILNRTSKKTCYNEKKICCSSESLMIKNSLDECGLNAFKVKLDNINSLKSLKGFFQLRLLNDENYNQIPSLNITPNPNLNLINVNFNEFYSIKSDSWLCLVNFGTLGYIINLKNVILTKSFFSYGFFFYNDIEKDPYYSYLSSFQKNQIFNKYSSSNLYNSTFIFNNILISKYDEYNFTIEKGFLGSFTKCFLYFSNEKNINKYYFFNNTLIKNNNLATNWTFILVNSLNLINKLEYIINNTIFKDNFNLLFGIFSATHLQIDRLFYDNSQSVNSHIIDLLNYGSISINNSYIYKINFDLSQSYFINGVDFDVSISKIIFLEHKGTIFRFIYSQTTIFNSSFILCKASPIYVFTISNLYGGITFYSNQVINFNMSDIDALDTLFIYSKSTFSLTLNITNVSLINILTKGNVFYFIYVDLSDSFSSIFISKIFVDNIKSTSKSKLGKFIFFRSFSGNFFSSFILNDVYANEVQGFRITFVGTDYFYILINNLIISNLRTSDYYIIFSGKIPNSVNVKLELINIKLHNITTPQIYNLFFIYAYNLLIKNLTLLNITNHDLDPSKTRAAMITINGNSYGSVRVDSVKFDLVSEKLLYRKIFWTYKFENVTFSNINFICISNTQCIIQPIIFAIIADSYLINATIINIHMLYSANTEESGMFYFSYGNNATIIGNIFINNTADKFSILYFLEFLETKIYYNKFLNSSGINGGCLNLRRVFSINLKFLDILESRSTEEGGSITIYEANNLNINNIFVTNSYALENGGILYLDSIDELFLENSQLKNSKSEGSGGAFYFNNVINVFLEYIEIYNTTSILIGGVLYLHNSNLITKYFNISLSFSSIGGAMYILGNFQQVIELEKIIFKNCYANDKASMLYISSIQSVKINNSIFLNNFVENLGGIFLSLYNDNIFDEEIQKLYNFSVSNSFFYNNSGQSSIIYSSSNYLIFIEKSKFENIKGSIYFIESKSNSKISISDVEIINCNYKLDDIQDSLKVNYIKALITFNRIDVQINNLIFKESLNSFDLFEIKSCNLIVNNSNFSNFFNIESNIRIFFSLKNSNLDFLNSHIFYNNNTQTNGFLNSSFSSINLTNCTFRNANIGGSAIFNLISSILILNHSSFSYLNSQIGVILIQKTNLIIEDCYFDRNIYFNYDIISDDSASIIDSRNEFIEPSFLYIRNTVIKNQRRNVLSIKKLEKVIIENSSFISDLLKNSEQNDFSRAIYADDCNSIIINSTSFEKFNSKSGGAILFIQKNDNNPIMNINFINCYFKNNSAYFGGIIYMTGSIILKMYQTYMHYNRAIKNIHDNDSGKGGCIITDCENYPNCSMEITNSNFENNVAETIGPTLLLKVNHKIDFFLNNSFKNNYDAINFTDNIASLPIKKYIISSFFNRNLFLNFTNLSNFEKTKKIINEFGLESLKIASGQNFNFSLIILDQYNQTILTDSQSIAILSCLSDNNQSILIEKSMAQAIEGILGFENTKIIWFPNSILNCVIKTKISDSTFFKSSSQKANSESIVINDFFLKIQIRNCSKGEILMGDHSCLICSSGTYSLEDPMTSYESIECKTCPENAICNGGSTLFPKVGNWRSSKNSSLILECANEEACLGSDPLDPYQFNLTIEEFISGKCNDNYHGNLCFLCKSGLAKPNENANCEPCRNMVWIYIKIAFGIIFVLLYIHIQSNIYGNLSNQEPNLAILFKLFLNHFQIIGMVSVVNLGWTIDFNVYFNFLEYFSFLYKDFFNIDCIIQNIDHDIFMQKIIFTVLLPIIFCCLILGIWILSFLGILFKLKKNSSSKLKHGISLFLSKKIRVTFLTLIFIFYPEILRKCFMLLNCLTIDDSIDYSVLRFSPNIECWGKDHNLWALTIVLPGILLWGIISPLFIFYVLYNYRFNIARSMSDLKKSTISIHKNKTLMNENKFLKKNTIIDIDETITNKLFEKIEFPFKNISRYQKLNYIFTEQIMVNKKKKSEILEEMSDNNIDKIDSEIIEIIADLNNGEIIKNEDKLIKDINQFNLLLNFFEYDKNLLQQIDLENTAVRIRVNYEINKYKTSRKLIFGGKKKLLRKDIENRQEDDNSIIFKNLGFIYKGYKEEFYYWEIILFARKFLLLMIGVFSEIFPKQTKESNLILILITFFFMHLKCKPYEHHYLNRAENISLLTAAVTAQIGIILYSDSMKKASKFFLFIIMFVNFCYISYWIYCLKKYSNIKEKILKYFKKYINKKGKK